MEGKELEKIKWVFLDHNKSHWHLSPTEDLPAFLRALRYLVPPDSVVYFEAGSPDREIKTFLKDRSLKDRPIIPMGTVSPKPAFYHLPVTPDNLDNLAQIAEHHSAFEIAGHVHVYVEQTLILQWFDAFMDPICISGEIPEKAIQLFCSELKLSYEKAEGG